MGSGVGTPPEPPGRPNHPVCPCGQIGWNEVLVPAPDHDPGCCVRLSRMADFIRPRFSSSWAMCRAMEPIGRLGPVSARVTALTHLAYQRDGLSRPSGRPRFEVGFPLRCFQRLSRPYLATRPCRWRDNRFTRGTSIPVLSY